MSDANDDWRKACAETIRSNPGSTIEPTLAGRNTPWSRSAGRLRPLVGGDGKTLELGELLGRGGMGEVRLADQLSVGRKVAVKTLRENQRGENAAVKLFAEGRVTGDLEHPNVVPVHDIGLDESGMPLIVLKRIEGASWDDVFDDEALARQRFGAGDLLEWNLGILMQVCRAVHFAHSRGVIHRDLKPDNVMLGDFGEVYLVDWGIAVRLNDSDGRTAGAGECTEMAGTPLYMAPEMLGRGAPLSRQTDVYLLGATLYELVCGHPPHQGDSAGEIIRSVLRSSPPFPDGVPPELARICRRAMDVDPSARFETAEQFRLALQGYLQRRGAARLTAEATRRLETLADEIKNHPDDPGAHRLRLYNLLAECRFGFREALSTWRDFDAARDGWTSAVELMVDYELAQGDPRAAEALVAELAEPPPKLRHRVDAAVAAKAEEDQRAQELAAIGREHDPHVGRRTRQFVIACIGMLWTAIPGAVAIGALPALSDRLSVLAAPVGFTTVGVALWLWGRDSLLGSAFNRRIMGALAFVFVAQIAMTLGLWSLGVSVSTIEILHLFLWACVAGMVALTIEPKSAPAALAYLLAFALASRWPELRYHGIAASNAALTITVLVIWRHLDSRPPDP